MKLVIWTLLIIGCLVAMRVEWLNAGAGSPLPIRNSAGEEGFDRGRKLRRSPYVDDRFWERETRVDWLAARPRIHIRSKFWNQLLEFGRPVAILQFPLLVVAIAFLSSPSRKMNGFRFGPSWWFALGVTAMLVTLALYRDYSYGYYGL